MIRFRHQSGPPPCSAPKTSVPALLAAAPSGPLTLAAPVAAGARASVNRYRRFRGCDECLLLCTREAWNVLHGVGRAVAPDLCDHPAGRLHESADRRCSAEVLLPGERDDARRQRRLERPDV